MLIMVGPSASGKTDIVKKIVETSHMKKLVTYTTRSMRYGEVEGVDYNFVTIDDFKEKLDNGFFFEHVIYNENYYGTALNDIAPDRVVILEPNGLKEYVAKAKDKIKIVYLESTEETRRKRMIERRDQINVINQRLKGDRLHFNDEIKKLADWVVDSETQTVTEVAEQVLELYLPYSK